ncbi:MAG: hypothetical protein PWQ55_2421 [Chloroflexota bacterium]|nr:hypothetical protein [Chloroflexota bacterium]
MDIAKLTAYCRMHLDLETQPLDYVTFYASLPLAVVDAVFSNGGHYNATKHAVFGLAEYYDIPITRKAPLPAREKQFSIADFLELYQEMDAGQMAAEVYHNRQRTAPRNGILKAEAARRFAQVLADFGVQHLQDVHKVLGLQRFTAAIRVIPGQRSGLSLHRFTLLVCEPNHYQTDGLIKRFLYEAAGERLSDGQCLAVLRELHAELVRDYPPLTPRALDSLICEARRKRIRII